jgi:hypothetical protein
MWATSQGDRTLTGQEASLVLGAVGYLRDMITVGVEIDEPHQTDVAIFNALQPTQQLAVLHDVAFALLDEQTPMPELNATREATVYVLFRELLSLVEIEIDMSRLENVPHRDVRSAILAAYEDVSWNTSEWDECSEFLNEIVDNETTVEHPFSADNVEIDRWFYLLESLADQILWDRDFELEAIFADRDPERVEMVKQVMGIGNDYFSVPAPDAFSDEYEKLDRDLIALTSASRPVFEASDEATPCHDDTENEF